MCHQPLREVNIQSNPCLKSGAFVHILFHICLPFTLLCGPLHPCMPSTVMAKCVFTCSSPPPRKGDSIHRTSIPNSLPPPKKKKKQIRLSHVIMTVLWLTYRKTPQKEGLKQDSNLSCNPPNNFAKAPSRKAGITWLSYGLVVSWMEGISPTPRQYTIFANHSKPDLHGLIPNMGR